MISALRGAVIVHDGGVATYVDDIKAGSTVEVNSGEATFTGTVRSNTVVTVTGGLANFYGEILNETVFNLSGGQTVIDTLKNNATLNITGGAQLTLVQAVGNSATLNLAEGGTLVLDGDDIFGNSSALNTTGGTILTQGNDVTFWEANLGGSTVIDLGGVTGNVDLGEISGEGEIVFTNWTPETVIFYDTSSTITPSIQLVFEGAGTVVDGNSASPVPEPALTALAVLLAAGGWVAWRRRG